MPILDQAANYRVRPKPADLKRGAEKAIQNTAEVIRREVPPVFAQQLTTPPEILPPPETLLQAEMISDREITVEINDVLWQINIELSTDPAIGDWVSISDLPSANSSENNTSARQLKIRLSLAHPFMDRFSGADADRIEPILRIAAAICLAETSARESGVRSAGTIRRNINDLLRNALAKS